MEIEIVSFKENKAWSLQDIPHGVMYALKKN